MKVLLDIKDDKADFILEVLKNFKYVKTEQLTAYKSEVFTGVKQAVKEMNLITSGKMQGISAQDLINEL